MEDKRATLLASWLDLTRRVLPGMAAGAGWPIRLDHCFMRVCLDHAYGGVWTAHIPRPAVQHMDDAALRRAVAVAHRIRDDPALLPGLNQQSLAWRGKTGPRTVRKLLIQ